MNRRSGGLALEKTRRSDRLAEAPTVDRPLPFAHLGVGCMIAEVDRLAAQAKDENCLWRPARLGPRSDTGRSSRTPTDTLEVSFGQEVSLTVEGRMKLVAIAGALRRVPEQEALRLAVKLLSRGREIDLVDLRALAIPFYDGDLERFQPAAGARELVAHRQREQARDRVTGVPSRCPRC
jgi:hypothetical protein